MELDARGHGYDGKLHADRWTAEYVGRGNHALDAACFRSTRAVSSRTRTLALPPPSSHGEEGAHKRTTEAAVRELRVFYYEAQVLSTGEDEELDELDDDLIALDARQRLARRAQLMGLPSSSSSAVGAARNAAGHPYSGGARVSWRERARQLVQARVQEAEAPVRAVAGDDHASDAPLNNGTTAASAESDAAMEGDALTAERGDGSRSAWHLYQTNSNGNGNSNNGGTGGGSRGSPWLEAEAEDEEDPDMRYYQILARNANGNRSSGGATGSIGGSGMHFAFTLSSRALQHMRSRYERRRLRRSSEKKRYNHRVAVGFSFGKLPLKMNERAGRSHTDDAHLRTDDEKIPLGHDDLGQSARSLAYVGKTGRVVSNGKEYLECDKYGAGDVVGCGILFDSKTFFFTLNGKLMGMVAATDVHHLDFFVEDDDADDSSDCFASAFDWYEPEADGGSELDGSDVDIDGDDDEIMSDADSSIAEDHELYPSMSLHRTGECVRTVFAPKEFKFDLFNFQKQVLKERQRSLGSDALPSVQRKQVDDDAVMDALVLDYFKHYGYEGAFEALRSSMQTASGPSKSASPRKNGFCDVNHEPGAVGAGLTPSMDQAGHSLALRSEVRRCVRCFETARALEMIERLPYFATLQPAPRYQRVLLYCHMLCVLDVAQPRPSKSKAASPRSPTMNGGGSWSAEKAIACAQSVFAAFISATGKLTTSSAEIDGMALQDDLALFMSILLYDDPSKLPADSRARLFMTSDFRERVADELNSILLSAAATNGGPVAGTPRSSLESFLADLEALRATSLRHGCRVFPESAASLSAQLSASRKRKEQQRRARADDGDEDDDLSSGSDDSSSSASSRGGRQRHDDDDDEEEEEEEEE